MVSASYTRITIVSASYNRITMVSAGYTGGSPWSQASYTKGSPWSQASCNGITMILGLCMSHW